MELTSDHLDLLRAVHELEEPDRHPSTKAVGARLLAIWKERGGPYAWHGGTPWHGTDPYALDLRSAELLDVHFGIAKYRHPSQPIEPHQEYWLGLTDPGREVLNRPPAV